MTDITELTREDAIIRTGVGETFHPDWEEVDGRECDDCGESIGWCLDMWVSAKDEEWERPEWVPTFYDRVTNDHLCEDCAMEREES